MCHEEFKCGEEVVELPCNHCYHESCVMPWLASHNTCPVCRLELPVEGERGGGGGSSSRHPSRREQSQPQRGASSRRQQDVGQGQGEGATGGGFVGSLNQLLHSIADRWEASHGDQAQAGSPTAAGSASPAPASRQPSSSGGNAGAPPGPSRAASSVPQPSAPPESPRHAAGRAAAARAAAPTAGGSAGPAAQEHAGETRSQTQGAQQPQQAQQQQQPDNGMQQLAAVGSALAALVNGAIGAFMGRNRGPQQ